MGKRKEARLARESVEVTVAVPKAKSSGFDPELDEVIHDFGEIEDTGYFAAVKSYDGGAHRLTVWTEYSAKAGKRTQQVFKLPIGVAADLIEGLADALDEYGESK